MRNNIHSAVLISYILRQYWKIEIEYLNPLWLYLEETYIRLQEIKSKVATDGNLPWLLYINNASELTKQKNEWFVNEGTYLTSSGYFAACLFASLKKYGKTFLIYDQAETRILYC